LSPTQDHGGDDRTDEAVPDHLRFGIGVDNVDIDAATASGIVVTKVRIIALRSSTRDGLLLCCQEDSVFKRAGACRTVGDAGGGAIHGCVAVLGLVGFGRIRSSWRRRQNRSGCAW